MVTLQGTSVNGCVGLFVIQVYRARPADREIPNVFSPNGDGENDTFAFLDFRGFDTFSFKVFNCWGMLVHETRTCVTATTPSGSWPMTCLTERTTPRLQRQGIERR